MTKAQRAAWVRLRALADRLEPVMRLQVIRALEALQRAVPLDRLERAILTRDAFAIHDLAGTLPARLRPSVRLLDRAHAQAGVVGKLALQAAGVGVRFDIANPFAVAAARENGARFVTEVTAETRLALRTVVSRAFTEGIPPREAARLVRPLIGLTSRQAQAVLARRTDLVAAGLSRVAAARDAAAYAAKLLRYRATLIARTEIMRASNDGELSAWREAQRMGLLGRAEKVWIVTPDDRLCPRCRPLDGARAPLGSPFITLRGRLDGPPLHPSCRCTIGLVPVPVRGRRAA
jgi:SPP1 gp7 family putative phage head morphogenesis protein